MALENTSSWARVGYVHQRCKSQQKLPEPGKEKLLHLKNPIIRDSEEEGSPTPSH